MGAGACVFKWGAKGSYVHTGDEQFRVPGFQIKVSDTTGCGDSYCGGFVAGLALGRNLRQACELGTATSALVATALGLAVAIIAVIFYNYFQTRISNINGLFRIQVAKVLRNMTALKVD